MSASNVAAPLPAHISGQHRFGSSNGIDRLQAMKQIYELESQNSSGMLSSTTSSDLTPMVDRNEEVHRRVAEQTQMQLEDTFLAEKARKREIKLQQLREQEKQEFEKFSMKQKEEKERREAEQREKEKARRQAQEDRRKQLKAESDARARADYERRKMELEKQRLAEEEKRRRVLELEWMEREDRISMEAQIRWLREKHRLELVAEEERKWELVEKELAAKQEEEARVRRAAQARQFEENQRRRAELERLKKQRAQALAARSGKINKTKVTENVETSTSAQEAKEVKAEVKPPTLDEVNQKESINKPTVCKNVETSSLIEKVEEVKKEMKDHTKYKVNQDKLIDEPLRREKLDSSNRKHKVKVKKEVRESEKHTANKVNQEKLYDKPTVRLEVEISTDVHEAKGAKENARGHTIGKINQEKSISKSAVHKKVESLSLIHQARGINEETKETNLARSGMSQEKVIDRPAVEDDEIPTPNENNQEDVTVTATLCSMDQKDDLVEIKQKRVSSREIETKTERKEEIMVKAQVDGPVHFPTNESPSVANQEKQKVLINDMSMEAARSLSESKDVSNEHEILSQSVVRHGGNKSKAKEKKEIDTSLQQGTHRIKHKKGKHKKQVATAEESHVNDSKATSAIEPLHLSDVRCTLNEANGTISDPGGKDCCKDSSFPRTSGNHNSDERDVATKHKDKDRSKHPAELNNDHLPALSAQRQKEPEKQEHLTLAEADLHLPVLQKDQHIRPVEDKHDGRMPVPTLAQKSDHSSQHSDNVPLTNTDSALFVESNTQVECSDKIDETVDCSKALLHEEARKSQNSGNGSQSSSTIKKKKKAEVKHEPKSHESTMPVVMETNGDGSSKVDESSGHQTRASNPSILANTSTTSLQHHVDSIGTVKPTLLDGSDKVLEPECQQKPGTVREMTENVKHSNLYNVKTTSVPKATCTNQTPMSKETMQQVGILPFAKVTGVSDDSPAMEACLLIDDLIVNFGGITYAQSKALKMVAQCVQANVEKAVPLIVLRLDGTNDCFQQVRIQLRPRKWSGKGMLGCQLVPFKWSQELEDGMNSATKAKGHTKSCSGAVKTYQSVNDLPATDTLMSGETVANQEKVYASTSLSPDKIRELDLVPFAKVVSVSMDSPAMAATLQADDLIANFGGITSKVSKTLKAIAQCVQKHILQTITLIVLRSTDVEIYETHTLYLTPQEWSGKGMLGCQLAPYEWTIVSKVSSNPRSAERVDTNYGCPSDSAYEEAYGSGTFLLIYNIVPNSLATNMGLHEADILMQCGDVEDASNERMVKSYIKQWRKKMNIVLELQRWLASEECYKEVIVEIPSFKVSKEPLGFDLITYEEYYKDYLSAPLENEVSVCMQCQMTAMVTQAHAAAMLNHPDCLRVLIEADQWVVNTQASGSISMLEWRDNDGRTPMYYSCYAGHIDCIRTLLEHRERALAQGFQFQSVSDNYGDTPLHAAAASNCINAARLLLESQYVAVDSTNSALMNAAHASTHADMLKELGKFHIDFLATDVVGRVPLFYAVERNDIESVRYLCTKFPDFVDYADMYGNIPLHLALWFGFVEVARILLEYMPELSLYALNIDGYSPLDYARVSDSNQVLEFLAEIDKKASK